MASKLIYVCDICGKPLDDGLSWTVLECDAFGLNQGTDICPVCENKITDYIDGMIYK